jgi:hypothetical protein
LDPLVGYFAAEKSEAGLFMAVGIAAVAASAWLWLGGSAYKAMAYPLIAIAAIQLVVGATVFFRTDAQVAALQAQYGADRAAFKAAETPRMEAVVRNFRLYKGIEIALLATGILLTFLLRHSDAWYAVGIGLIIQSSLMLVLDLFAERRADEYLRFVLGSG